MNAQVLPYLKNSSFNFAFSYNRIGFQIKRLTVLRIKIPLKEFMEIRNLRNIFKSMDERDKIEFRAVLD